MNHFLIIIEKVKKGYSVYSPDLPGCVATGNTGKQAEKNMHEAIFLHLEGLKEDHRPIPQSTTFAEYIAIAP